MKVSFDMDINYLLSEAYSYIAKNKQMSLKSC